MDRMPHNRPQSPVPRHEFDELLREWHGANTPTETIGDIGDFAGRGWTYVEDLGRRFRLHADTNWHGVGRYLELLQQQQAVDWWIVANERGKKNKAAFGSDREVIPGFFLYADEA